MNGLGPFAGLSLAVALLGCASAEPSKGVQRDDPAAVQAISQPKADASIPPSPSAFATARPDAPPCGDLSKMKLGDAKPLLQGRLAVRSVEGAQDSPVPWDIMGAPDSPTDRSRIYFEKGKVGLAVVATERYQRAGKDFLAKAKERLDEPGGEVVDVKTGDEKLRLVAWLPTAKPERTNGTAFLLLGYAVHPDGTVQYLQIGTFPEQLTDVEGCRALALRVAETLVPGKRALESKAGERAVAFLDKKFTATVPEGWVVSTQPGPDFAVVRVRELSQFPEPPPELGIALTGHPPRLDTGNAKSTQSGKLLGRPATWHVGEVPNTDGKPVLFAKARVDLGGHDVADAWINSFVADARARAIAIATSMKPSP